MASSQTPTETGSDTLCPPGLETHLRPDLFRALGDPTRLALVARLATATEPLTVTEASTCCGVHLSGVSRHLTHLAQEGVVASEREGREVRYRLNRDQLASALRGLADALDACCGGASDAASDGTADRATGEATEQDGGTT